MAEQFRRSRAILVEGISHCLSILVTQLEIAARNNLPNYNVDVENTMAGLLNRIHGWNLVTANSNKLNYLGVDLVDIERKIAVQITSTNTVSKIDHTLEYFSKNALNAQFDKLYIVVLTNQSPTHAMMSRSLPPWFYGKEDIWSVPTIFRMIMDLSVVDLEDIRAYLDRELALRLNIAQRPSLYLPPVSALSANNFVGREAELTAIQERFDRGDKLVVLSGLGGIGKTELAVRFGQDYRNGTVYFIRFDVSFTHTVAKMANGIRPALSHDALVRPDEELCAMVLEILKSCTKKDILIIDNVDANQGSLRDLMRDSVYRALMAMDLRIIMTTRFEDRRAAVVNPMPNKMLYEVFAQHGVSMDERQMDDLIEAVNGHTLTVDLMARMLKGFRKTTAEMLLHSLKNNTLANEKYRRIATDYNRSTEQGRTYQHLATAFDLSGISENCKAVMRYATLLPDNGINGETFGGSLNEEELDALDTLLEHGWLVINDGLLEIHPVIRMVCREELQPTDENCSKFLTRLWLQLDFHKFERVRYAGLAELFANAADISEDAETKAEWLNCSGRLLLELMEYPKAKTLYERCLPDLEIRIPASPALATAYNNVGYSCGNLGDYNKALEYQLKALEIREKTLPAEHPDLADSYNSVGYTYGDLGDHRKALEFKLKTLSIREKVLPAEHPDLAESYNSVGYTYGDLGDHRKALEYQLKALDIREKVLPVDHLDLAESYNSVGYTYGDLGDHRKALEYQLRALDIREKVLQAEHPDLADSYNSVGYTYGDLGDYNKALEYQLKALSIHEKVLPTDHPDLAFSYNGVGYTYGYLGDHGKALEYKLKALDIRAKVLPKDHPDLAVSYNNVGLTYGALGDHNKALECQLNALEIQKKVLPSNHPDIAVSYNNVGLTYGALGDHNKALECQLNALEIQEKVLPSNHPDIANSYNNAGSAYSEMGEYQKALEYQLKALNIRKHILPPDHPYLGVSYNYVGVTYVALGDYSTALEYQMKAVSTYEKVLPQSHPYLAAAYDNVGHTYDALGDYEKATEFKLQSRFPHQRLDSPQNLNFADFVACCPEMIGSDITSAYVVTSSESWEAEKDHISVQYGLGIPGKYISPDGSVLLLLGISLEQVCATLHDCTDLQNLFTFSVGNVQLDLSRFPKLQQLQLERVEADIILPQKHADLTVVNLKQCQLANADFLSKLPALRNLTLIDISTVGGGMSIPDLTFSAKLIHVNLRKCDIRVLGELPDNVEYLSLAETGLTQIPEMILKLKNLKQLNISKLQLEFLPIWLADLELPVRLEKPFPERAILLVDTQVDRIDISTIPPQKELLREWLEAAQPGTENLLNEIKVIFLGDGEAGKTHIIARLKKDGECIPVTKNEESSGMESRVGSSTFTGNITPGIAITDHTMVLKDRTIKVHYWDFGGQEFLHAMHRIFMTKKTLYVVVLNARNDTQDHRAEFWLQNINSVDKNAQVVLVLNKIDQNPRASINENRLRRMFPSVRNVIRMSARDDSKEQFERNLIQVLRERLEDFDALNTPFPPAWRAVREKLEHLPKPYIQQNVFARYCREAGITDLSEQAALKDRFSELGVSFSCKERTLLLKPTWVTNAIYRILFNQRKVIHNGVINIEDIEDCLASEEFVWAVDGDIEYDEAGIAYILEVMRTHKLSYLIPQYLQTREFIPMLCERNESKLVGELANIPVILFLWKFSGNLTIFLMACCIFLW